MCFWVCWVGFLVLSRSGLWYVLGYAGWSIVMSVTSVTGHRSVYAGLDDVWLDYSGGWRVYLGR
jgi:hypothetical protein